MILINVRKSPEDFTATYKCTFCDNFSEYLKRIWPLGMNKPTYICKTCLTGFIEEIDKTAIEDMKNEKQGE